MPPRSPDPGDPAALAALHAYNALAGLPLPASGRAALLLALHRAARQPLPDMALAAAWMQQGPRDDLPAPGRDALLAALTAPDMAASLSAALADLTGQPPVPSPPPPHRPHPLGEGADFPPRVAEVLGLDSLAVHGTPRPLPGIPFSTCVLDFRQALRQRPPPRSAVILGGGYVGAELALGWGARGCRVVLLDRRQELMRGYIPAQAARIQALLVEAGVEVRLGVHVLGCRVVPPGVRVEGQRTVGESGRAAGRVLSWTAERLVVAAGVEA